MQTLKKSKIPFFKAYTSEIKESSFLKNKSLSIFYFWTFLKMSIFKKCIDFFFIKMEICKIE